MSPQDVGSLVLSTHLSRAVYRHATEQVVGMKLKDYIALRHLQQEPSTTQRELAGVMQLDSNNCVILLNELEDRGHARRTRDPADRRRHRVVITDEGREALRAADAAVDGLEDQLLGPLDADERATLRSLLDRAVSALPPTP